MRLVYEASDMDVVQSPTEVLFRLAQLITQERLNIVDKHIVGKTLADGSKVVEVKNTQAILKTPSGETKGVELTQKMLQPLLVPHKPPPATARPRSPKRSQATTLLK